MRLATISYQGQEQVAVVEERGLIPLAELITQYDLPTTWQTDMKHLITTALDELVIWYNGLSSPPRVPVIPFTEIQFLPLYRNPDKIWSIGLNYSDHAADLDEGTPELFPGSFMRPATTIIGFDDEIMLSPLSQRTTGEAELAIVIGKQTKDIAKDSWLDAVAGFTTIIDMTAEDILRHNPRFLTLAKAFDTFFSFGPVLITADEFTTDQVFNLEVSTIHNGQIHASNQVKNMRYPPDYLVSFHSQVMTLLPGDIIATGTPRARQIENGDTIGCNISGFYSLHNPVRRLSER